MIARLRHFAIHGKYYYGWIIVAISFAAMVAVFGIRLSFSVFFVALIDEFGWARASTSVIFSMSMITFAGTSTFAGLALDKFGVRKTFGTGTLVLALGLFLSSRVNTYWQLVFSYGVIAGLGITILGLALQASLISNWFKQFRGIAIGIAFAGTGVGALLITPSVEWLIRVYDWRTAFTALSLLAAMGFPFVVFFLRSKPEQLGLFIDGRNSQTKQPKNSQLIPPEKSWTFQEAIRSRPFWLIMLAGFGAIGPVRMLTVHQLAIMTDVGIPRATAAGFVGLSGIVIAIVFIMSGALSDRIGRRLTYILGAISMVAALLLLNAIQSPENAAWLGLYILLFGIGEGSRASLVTAVAADLFPGQAIGAINGTTGAMFGLGAAFLPWLAGLIFDNIGSYSPAIWLAITWVVISSVALHLARH